MPRILKGSTLCTIVIASALACRSAEAPDPVRDVRYDVTDVSALLATDSVQVQDVNDRMQIVGWRHVQGEWEGFLWEDGALTELPCLPWSINVRGQIGCQIFENYPFGPEDFLWENGQLTRLLPEGELSHDELYVTDSSAVVGASGRMYRWQNGVLERKAALLSGLGRPNNLGDVPFTVHVVPYFHGHVWFADGTDKELGGFGRYSRAMSMNDSGDIVGLSERSPMRGAFAVIWRKSTGFVADSLGTADMVTSEAVDINNRGRIIGASSRGAFLFEDGKLSALADLVPEPWTGISARRITEGGLILATAKQGGAGKASVVLLTPRN